MSAQKSERLLGNAAFHQGDFDGAIAHYSAVLASDPGNARLLSNRAAAYLRKRDSIRADAHEFQDLTVLTVRDAQATITALPSWWEGWHRLFAAHYGVGAEAAAVQVLEDGILKCPESADLKEALRQIKGKGDGPAEVKGRGILIDTVGRYDAEASLRKSSDAERVKADSLFQGGDWTGAIESYTRSIKMATNVGVIPHIYAYTNRSLAWLRHAIDSDERRAYDEAVKDAEICIALDPTRAKAWLRKSVALLEDGKPAAARAVVLEGFKYCPGNTRLTETLGQIDDVIQECGEESDEETNLKVTTAKTDITPLTLQDAVAYVAAGNISAGPACQDLISAEACSASVGEWGAAHMLLMQAVRNGEIEGCRAFRGIDLYWLNNLYLPSRLLLVVGSGEDEAIVKSCLLQAEHAGVIGSADAVMVSMISRLDLRQELLEFRSAGQRMMQSIVHILIQQGEQADQLHNLELRVADMKDDFQRYKRVQKWTQFANVIFSLVPLAGGSIACGVAGAVSVFEGMDLNSLFQSLLSIGADNQALATEPLLKCFFKTGSDVLSPDAWNAMPDNAKALLKTITQAMGVSVARLRKVVLETAQGLDVDVGSVDLNDDTQNADDGDMESGVDFPDTIPENGFTEGGIISGEGRTGGIGDDHSDGKVVLQKIAQELGFPVDVVSDGLRRAILENPLEESRP